MPHYYFDVKNGRRQVDSMGAICRDDEEAIAMAKSIATKIAVDTSHVGHQRHVVVINDVGHEIFETPVA